MNKPYAKIVSVGRYIPEAILTNKELENMVDTSDEWITTRTGIKTRHIAKQKHETTSWMAYHAAVNALEKANVSPQSLDCIIVATVTPDYMFPSVACLIQKKLKATNAFAYDINAACSGFIYGLTTASMYISSKSIRYALLIGVEKLSAITNYKDRTTCPLFGDAAGAVVLTTSDDDTGLIDYIHHTDGDDNGILYVPAGGTAKPTSTETLKQGMHYLYQNGKAIFKRASMEMAQTSTKLIERNNLSIGDISWVIPHQANKRIIDMVQKLLNISKEKVVVNIDKYGNTSSATIPLCLYDIEDKLSYGDNIILTAFGGGLTWGSSYVKWSY